MIAIISATVNAPSEVTDEHQAPVAQHRPDRDAAPLVEQRERNEGEDAGEQVEAQQVEHAETHREQDCADQGLPVCTVMVTANAAASARIAPAMNARITVSRVDMNTLVSPASITA